MSWLLSLFGLAPTPETHPSPHGRHDNTVPLTQPDDELETREIAQPRASPPSASKRPAQCFFYESAKPVFAMRADRFEPCVNQEPALGHILRIDDVSEESSQSPSKTVPPREIVLWNSAENKDHGAAKNVQKENLAVPDLLAPLRRFSLMKPADESEAKADTTLNTEPRVEGDYEPVAAVEIPTQQRDHKYEDDAKRDSGAAGPSLHLLKRFSLRKSHSGLTENSAESPVDDDGEPITSSKPRQRSRSLPSEALLSAEEETTSQYVNILPSTVASRRISLGPKPPFITVIPLTKKLPNEDERSPAQHSNVELPEPVIRPFYDQTYSGVESDSVSVQLPPPPPPSLASRTPVNTAHCLTMVAPTPLPTSKSIIATAKGTPLESRLRRRDRAQAFIEAHTPGWVRRKEERLDRIYRERKRKRGRGLEQELPDNEQSTQ